MRISDLRIRVVEPTDFVFQWREDIPPIQLTMTVFEVVTDEGITGVSTSWLPAGPNEIAESADHFFRPLLIGRDPFDRESIWQELMRFTRYLISPKAASNIDIALWDIAGKAAGLPVYKLLGAYRHEVPVYITTETQKDAADYARIAVEQQQANMHAVKIHAAAVPDKDIEACRAVREAVGPGYTLMLDATSAYDWEDAVRVGRELERLNFRWYEDPIRDDDVAGFVQLCKTLDIPVYMAESTARGPWPMAHYLATGAADGLRGVGDILGGITGLRKVGDLAELHNRRFEPHSYGSTLVQAAHLHHILATRSCEYFELPHPRGPMDFGMKTTLEISEDGYVHAPTAPGLGYEVDWDVIDNATVKQFT
ncbi:mandelate racemase [Amycolatopsis acidicola]|uniref:Mandelate racemase n=1 Tax=Amycolatopsis acidicola TaxID=2596893 RepID=A0A5N0UP65_9PSEU|nr:enolase C-terminal domain-like protein [Amycolatopsis acidicola]KAA9151854.1 mandelate racemase [Amycolatopsis acidicola]